MKNLIKYGVLAVAGYLAYQRFVKPAVTTTTDETDETITDETTPAPPPSRRPPVRDLVKAKAAAAGQGANPLLSFHQWNYYYEQVRGVPGPPIEDFPGIQAGYRMSVDEWWSAVAAKGLQGLLMGGYLR